MRRDLPALETPLALGVTLVLGGSEVRGATGGLSYTETTEVDLTDLRVDSLTLDDEGAATRLTVTARTTEWELDFVYRLTDRPPHVGLGFTVRRTPGGAPELLRDVRLTFTYRLGQATDWILNAPGNQLRSDLPVENIAAPLVVRGAGEGEGSAGLVAFTHRSDTVTTILWTVSPTEMGEMELTCEAGYARIDLATTLADRVSPDEAGLTWQTVYLDSFSTGWEEVRRSVAEWWRELGLTAPADAPGWLKQANIYEAYIGFAVFAGQELHCYPSVAALRTDLARIERLGFDVLQLMPRHPYPSYNVHDYADITTTYGDEAELRELVAEAHRRGIRVLLDIIMHGVLDKEIIDETLQAVLSGPHADRLDDATIDVEARFPEEVAWGRHIVDFAPFWREGSPEQHPLPTKHPDWFMRDSDQRITRRYTKAFDVANPDWQRYFIDACCDLVDRLEVDGFRVDAPMYNNFHNWSAQRRARASYSCMAPLHLLRDLRARLRTDYADVAMYTEPTGSLWRAVADATYNYDEHWLVEALFAEPRPHWERLFVRNAAEMQRWLQDRDATLPPGATIVHHVDSHDSMWWSPPGERWRIERFGQGATVALIAAFSLIGGAFMTFRGGEEGVEDALERAHDLRRRLPEIAVGTVDYSGAVSSSENVLAVLRESAQATSLVAVNLASSPVSCEVNLSRDLSLSTVKDRWSGEWIELLKRTRGNSISLEFAAFQPRVLRLAPV